MLPLPPEVVSVRLQGNAPAAIDLPWPYEESRLQEPRGYNHYGPQHRHLLKEVSIENVGTSDWVESLQINGDDWRHVFTGGARHIFTAWTHARSHAASGSELARDPWSMLRYWGYTLCGEDTRGLSAILHGVGIEGRSVPLNGHVAGEYQLDGRWSVLDGDQNIVYFNLDNRTLAGYAEIRADPFLALRTKPFGRFAQPGVAPSQFNAGLFEYIEPAVQKPFKFKEAGRGALAPLTLAPGERVIYHYDQVPETQAGDPNAPAWKAAAPAALRLVEWQVSPAGRHWKAGPLPISVDWPILSARNESTGESVEVKTTVPSFSCSVPVASAQDRITIWLQRSRYSLPVFHPGKNELTTGSGAPPLNVTVNFVGFAFVTQPRPPKITVPTLFRDAAPTFSVAVGPGAVEIGCDKIWWQIASDPRFEFVCPNLDQIEKKTATLAVDPLTNRYQRTAETIAIDPLTNTFFNDRGEYYVRMKTGGGSVWSEWSPRQKFRIEKPLAPFDPTATKLPDGRLRLQWKGPGEEFAIYASNRLDFLPECYADEQIVSMRGQEVLAKRPNKNLVTKTAGHTVDLPASLRYYRILARRGAAWSNPSPLLTLSAKEWPNLPPPVVFQIRWTTVDNAEARDVYLGEERPLRP